MSKINFPDEFNVMKEAIEEVFELDLHSTIRQRMYVNARMIFAKAMCDRGHTRTDVAKYLMKNHATVIHYLKYFDGYLATDAEFRKKYKVCTSLYRDKFEPMHKMNASCMKQRIIELRDDNEELQGKVKSLMLQIKMIHRKEDRFLEIYDIIHDRTRHGTEEMVKNKLNKMFNGLYG